MGITLIKASGPAPLEVVIAGGGVAGLEALLALHELAGPRVRVQLLAPESEFVYRPLAVAEPFGLAHPARVDISELAERHGAHHRQDSLAGVDAERRVLRTESGRSLRFDALLLAVGARPVEAVHGALTFRGPADVAAFGGLLEELAGGQVGSVAFAAHDRVRWRLPLYELALLSHAHLESLGADGLDWKLVTHETMPLEVFGERASREVAEHAGIETVTERVPRMATGGRLLFEDGGALEAERVVASPELQVPYLPGVPRGAGGFIPTDSSGRVKGLERVFAAGDATSFPIKQGGLAAQQADAAAARPRSRRSPARRSIRPQPTSCSGPRSSPAPRRAFCEQGSPTATPPPPRAAASCGGRPARSRLVTSLPISPVAPREDRRRRSMTSRRCSGRRPTRRRRIGWMPSSSRLRGPTRTPAGRTTTAHSGGSRSPKD